MSGGKLLNSVDCALGPAGPISFDCSNLLTLCLSATPELTRQGAGAPGFSDGNRKQRCHKFSSPETPHCRESWLSLGKAITSSGDWKDQASFYWES